MRFVLAMAAAVVGGLVCYPALAQPFPTQPPGPLSRPPVAPPTTPPLRYPGQLGPLRPIAPQATLPVDSFSSRDLTCAPGLDRAEIVIDARLAVQPNPVSGNQASIEIVIDGASVGSETLAIVNGGVDVSRRVPLSGAGGDHSVVFVLDGQARSEAQPLAHSCVSQTVTRTDHQPGLATLPNLAFGELMYAVLSPTPPPAARSGGGFSLLEPRVSIGVHRSFADPVIVRDLTTTTGRVQFPANDVCPGEIDAYISASFAIAVRVTRVADPQSYVAVQAGPFEPSIDYVDTLDGPRWASGEAVGSSDRYRGTPLPQGYQWIVVRTGLACTRNGVMEVRLDPADALSESNEGDNILRVRYATVAQ